MSTTAKLQGGQALTPPDTPGTKLEGWTYVVMCFCLRRRLLLAHAASSLVRTRSPPPAAAAAAARSPPARTSPVRTSPWPCLCTVRLSRRHASPDPSSSHARSPLASSLRGFVSRGGVLLVTASLSTNLGSMSDVCQAPLAIINSVLGDSSAGGCMEQHTQWQVVAPLAVLSAVLGYSFAGGCMEQHTSSCGCGHNHSSYTLLPLTQHTQRHSSGQASGNTLYSAAER